MHVCPSQTRERLLSCKQCLSRLLWYVGRDASSMPSGMNGTGMSPLALVTISAADTYCDVASAINRRACTEVCGSSF